MGLVNVGIMTGLLALAVPVIIHLLRSRRYRRAPLGTLRFLRQAVRETARWRRLRDLLLLLARLAVFALLTLLFARPYLRTPDDVAAHAMDVVLLLDASESMAGESLGLTNLELARETAARMLRELPAAANVTIAAFADRVWELSGVDDAALTAGGTADYRRALQWARDRLAFSTGREKRILLVTDLQNVGLPAVPFDDWPLDIGVDIVPLVMPGNWNAAITGVRVVSPYLGSEGIIEVDVGYFGEGLPADELMELVLSFEGQKEALRRNIPRRSDRIDFPWTPAHAGIWHGTARLTSDDAYPRDNARAFAFDIRAPSRVVLVDGKPGETAYEDGTYYLAMALNVAVREGAPSGFRAVQCTELGELRDSHVVALCNVETLPVRDIERLRVHVVEGGGLIYFLGDRVGPDAYTRLARSGLFPAELTRRRVAVPRHIADWDTRHPAMGEFSIREAGDLSRIIFREAFEFKLIPGARVLASLAGGGPAIFEKPLGKGRILVVTNPCDRQWSNWPAERIFVPVVRELFGFLAQAERPETVICEVSPGMEETRPPGVYDGPPITVVAPDPVEADVTVCEEGDFRQALGVGPPPLAAPILASKIEVPPGRERRNEWWRFLAVALLAVMFLENTLVDRGRA